MYDTDLPIRSDLLAAHERTVRRWSQPGNWWSADQRLAIVEQVRAALDAGPLPPWGKPGSLVSDLTDSQEPDSPHAAEVLPPAAVDAIWRITNHPGTLTHGWYVGVIAELAQSQFTAPDQEPLELGQEALAYVELVGIVAQANNLDRFADALELERIKLPAAEPGKPTREVDKNVAVREHWVPTADSRAPGVLKSLTAVPAEVQAWLMLSDAGYVPLASIRGDLISDHASLTRPQIELVAARTSKLNECFY